MASSISRFDAGVSSDGGTAIAASVEVTLADARNEPYRARLRAGNAKDRERLVKSWAPVLSRGPEQWLDGDWSWETFGEADLAFPLHPEWLVIVDEIESEARGDVLGVLVTTGPLAPSDAALTDPAAAAGALFWVEYIAIAPSLRPDCPDRDRRVPTLKGVGVRLMLAAIARSDGAGLAGRLGLHAEGKIACSTYRDKWHMEQLGEADHPAGGRFPVFYGDAAWAAGYRAKYER